MSSAFVAPNAEAPAAPSRQSSLSSPRPPIVASSSPSASPLPCSPFLLSLLAPVVPIAPSRALLCRTPWCCLPPPQPLPDLAALPLPQPMPDLAAFSSLCRSCLCRSSRLPQPSLTVGCRLLPPVPIADAVTVLLLRLLPTACRRCQLTAIATTLSSNLLSSGFSTHCCHYHNLPFLLSYYSSRTLPLPSRSAASSSAGHLCSSLPSATVQPFPAAAIFPRNHSRLPLQRLHLASFAIVAATTSSSTVALVSSSRKL